MDNAMSASLKVSTTALTVKTRGFLLSDTECFVHHVDYVDAVMDTLWLDVHHGSRATRKEMGR
jgi:hypothetical protein